MNDIYFFRPLCFFLFIPLGILVFLFLRKGFKKSNWEHFCSPDLIPYILEKGSKNSLKCYLPLFIALCLLIIAMTGPAFEKTKEPLLKTENGFVIALDLSPQMDAADIKPSRLQRAVYKIADLIKHEKEGHKALVVFSKAPYVVTPLTDDGKTILSMLGALQTEIMPEAGHLLEPAIEKSALLLKQAGIEKGSIILFTAELSDKDKEASIKTAKENGVAVFVLGVGKQEAVPIPKKEGGFLKNAKGSVMLTRLAEDNLKELATATGGLYQRLSSDDQDIEAFLYALKGSNGKTEDSLDSQRQKWHDAGYVFVLFALPLALFVFRRGFFYLLPLFVPFMADAADFDSLWKNRNQQAEELFHQGNYEEAEKLFEDPSWKACTDFRLGKYKESAEGFAKEDSVEALYNSATALAKEKLYQEALEGYKAALQKDPHHEDALYNKKIIEDFLKQNPPQDKKKDSSDKNSSDKKEEPSQEGGEDKDKKEESSNQQQEDKAEDQEGQKEEQEKLEKEHKEKVDQAIGEQNKKKEEGKEEPSSEEEEESEQAQIDKKWLQKVKDDPGGLLRRKFLYQYKQKMGQ